MSDKSEIMNDKTAGTSQSKTTVNFSHDQLYAAMRDAVDLLDGCHVFPFLMGEAARCAWDDKELVAEEIVFGLRRAEYTDVVKSILKTLRAEPRYEIKVTDDGATYKVEGVPVRVKVINRKYEFLQNLDRKWYQFDEYLFANPFEKFWKARFIVS